jgi:hypothetical protein
MPINKPIKITFSEPLKFANKWIELKSGRGTLTPLKKTIASNTLTLTPTKLLRKGTTYTVLLHTNSISDLNGNIIFYNMFRFTTTTIKIDIINKATGGDITKNYLLTSYIPKTVLTEQIFNDIRKNDDHKSIKNYRSLIEDKYHLSNYELVVIPINRKIRPFEDFNNKTPEWFKIYSGSKHDKLKLINEWNLKHSLFALGCLLLLVINHPTLDGKIIWLEDVKTRIFDLYGSRSRFVSDTVLSERDILGVGDEVDLINGEPPTVPLNKRHKVYRL